MDGSLCPGGLVKPTDLRRGRRRHPRSWTICLAEYRRAPNEPSNLRDDDDAPDFPVEWVPAHGPRIDQRGGGAATGGCRESSASSPRHITSRGATRRRHHVPHHKPTLHQDRGSHVGAAGRQWGARYRDPNLRPAGRRSSVGSVTPKRSGYSRVCWLEAGLLGDLGVGGAPVGVLEPPGHRPT